MAQRPVFLPQRQAHALPLVEARDVTFEWHPGMGPSQKRKSIVSLHAAAAARGFAPLLEVSTKSEESLGRQLSAFTLTLPLDFGRRISVESAFQGSKVFMAGGPYVDLYGEPGFAIKKDPRLSGPLKAFEFQGEQWPLLPRTAFYDWIYLTALGSQPGLGEQIQAYGGFTDIEFNPKKSLNCQAYSCALYVALKCQGLLEEALRDRGRYLEVVSQEARLF